MQMEHWIMIAMWLFGFAGFILLIPRKDWRKGIFAFLMFQALIWLCDMITFAFGWRKAPVRELPKATDMPLTLDYFFYPVLFAIYYVKKKATRSTSSRVIHFFIWTSVISLFDNTIERYTDLLKYDWRYLMWIYFWFLFYVAQLFCNWFFKDRGLFQNQRCGT